MGNPEPSERSVNYWMLPGSNTTNPVRQFVQTNPLSLFVLHSLEVAGFGGLMIGVLILVPLSGAAVLAYLTLHVLFGTLGHAGVEPLPASWSRLPVVAELGSSSFHAAHHRTPGVNFGFSTRLWDRLFGTLARDRDR